MYQYEREMFEELVKRIERLEFENKHIKEMLDMFVLSGRAAIIEEAIRHE